MSLGCSNLKKQFPHSELHWATRSDFASLLKIHPQVDRVWGLDRSDGMAGLWRLSRQLKDEGFTHIYDAHANVRSRLLQLFWWPMFLTFPGHSFVQRKKERWKRFLLFKLAINLFPKPYRGMLSYLKPLATWGVSQQLDPLGQAACFPTAIEEKVSKLVDGSTSRVALVPSAAWKMKRWPLDYWKQLIQLTPEKKFVVLGGPDDHFCQELEDVDAKRVVNVAGKLSLLESCYLISRCHEVVTADTGLLHVADLLGVKTYALVGPTAFGFPSGETVEVLEADLACRPCTKDGSGKCKQSIYQKCMIDIHPQTVAEKLK